MAFFSIPNTRIAGISTCVPKNVVANKDYKWISAKERELLIRKIGVVEKRIVTKGMTASDLCFESGKKLIEELKWNKEDIELIIFVSQSRDYLLPATACILQDKLGLPKTCLAIDVNLGCSGFVYGMSIIANYIAHCGIKKALMLIGDVTPLASYRDKTSYPLFGDAGAATAFEYDEKAAPMHFNLQSDGSGFKAIIIPDGGMRNYPTKKSFEYKSYGKGIIRNKLQIALDGYAVFNFSLREVAPNVRALLEKFDVPIDSIDFFLFHQANLLINESVRKKMKLDPEKVPYSLNRFGNTSSASIPTTIVSELRKKVSTEKLKMILCGFGVGLSWGSVYVQTDNICCPEIIEL
ncbi:MAG: ketoacyl-ACP synthase III [Bacteroidetes bacterium]|nr:ketoacyl-ACP synthase III [Bacteroidota bacterium]